MPIRGLRNLSYYWYKNRMDEQDRVDAYWDGDTQDLYHQQQLEEQEMATAKYEQKPGTIAVFKADKEGNDKRPDWTGNMMDPDGKALQVSLWISESQKGLTYLSGKVQEPYSPGSDGGNDSADDVPF